MKLEICDICEKRIDKTATKPIRIGHQQYKDKRSGYITVRHYDVCNECAERVLSTFNVTKEGE